MLERIRELCKKNGITIQKLEKDLGLSNGSIAKNENMRSDRLLAIAKYFGVSMEYIMGSNNIEYDETSKTWDITDDYYLNEETKKIAQFYFDNPDYRVLFDANKKVKPEDINKALTAIGLVIEE